MTPPPGVFSVPFFYGTADERAAGREAVDEAVAAWRAAGKPKVHVRCYTDRRGTKAQNHALAVERCKRVWRLLVRRGVPRRSLVRYPIGEMEESGPDGSRVPEARVARISFQ